MNKKVRLSAALSLLVLGAGALTACSSSNGNTPTTSGTTTVTLWARQNDTVINLQAAAFNKSQKKIKVVVTNISDANLLTKYATSIRAGNAPDIIDGDIIAAPLLSTQGVLEDLTSKVKTLSNLNDLAPAGVKIGKLDGKNYSLPVGLINSQMFWNKDLFKKAGLNPDKAPASLAEVKADAEKIRQLGPKIYGFSTAGTVGGAYTGFPSVWADGGHVVTSLGKNQKTTFNTPEVSNMLQWYQSMWTSKLMPPTEEPNQDPGGVGLQTIDAGNVGIMFTGTYAFNNTAGQKLDLGYANGIPGFTSGSLSSFVGGQNAGITKGSAHADQAWTFLKWLVSSDASAKVSISHGQLPPDLTQASRLASKDALIQSGLAALKVGQVPASVAYSSLINDANGPWTTAATSVIFNGASVSSALKKAQTAGDSQISQAYSQIGQ